VRNGVDRTALSTGIAVIAIGTVLLADQGSDLDISAGVLAAIFVAAFGLIMVISGLLEDR
jgi:hypothetical protein